jgi:hypothetical protein
VHVEVDVLLPTMKLLRMGQLEKSFSYLAIIFTFQSFPFCHSFTKLGENFYFNVPEKFIHQQLGNCTKHSHPFKQKTK